MDQQQLRNSIEACRPGSEDLHAPDMAELAEHLARDAQARAVYERSQRLDAALGAAFRDVAPPADLEQRLVAAVEAAGRETAVTASNAAPRVIPPAAKPPARGGKRFSARRLAIASAVAAVFAGVAVILSPWWSGPSELTPTTLVAHTQELLDDQDFANAAAWSDVTTPPRSFPGTWITVPPEAWRRVSAKGDRRAVAFRLRVRDKSAYLLVLKPAVQATDLGRAPPRKPFAGATGGWKIGAWSGEGFVYVLAMEGSEQDYRSLIRIPPTA
jgi:hypothetical protein